METAPAAWDVDASIAAFEAALCAEAASGACDVLRALDASDGVLGAPAGLPVAIPHMVAVATALRDHVDVAAWLRARGFDEAAAPPAAAPIDLAALGLAPADVLSAELQAASIVLVEGALDVPAAGATVGLQTDDGIVDVGVVVELPRRAGDAAPVWLVAGGAARLAAAIASGSAALVVTPAFETLVDDVDTGTYARPRGAARIAVRIELSVPVDARSIALKASAR